MSTTQVCRTIKEQVIVSDSKEIIKSKELESISTDILTNELKRRRKLQQQQREEEMKDMAIAIRELRKKFKIMSGKDIDDVF